MDNYLNGIIKEIKDHKNKIKGIMNKEKAIKYLYKDWLNYKKYYKDQDFNMKEGFISYLSREISLENLIPDEDNH